MPSERSSLDTGTPGSHRTSARLPEQPFLAFEPRATIAMEPAAGERSTCHQVLLSFANDLISRATSEPD